jgi:hypothetical protein
MRYAVLCSTLNAWQVWARFFPHVCSKLVTLDNKRILLFGAALTCAAARRGVCTVGAVRCADTRAPDYARTCMQAQSLARACARNRHAHTRTYTSALSRAHVHARRYKCVCLIDHGALLSGLSRQDVACSLTALAEAVSRAQHMRAHVRRVRVRALARMRSRASPCVCVCVRTRDSVRVCVIACVHARARARRRLTRTARLWPATPASPTGCRSRPAASSLPASSRSGMPRPPAPTPTPPHPLNTHTHTHTHSRSHTHTHPHAHLQPPCSSGSRSESGHSAATASLSAVPVPQ